MCGDFLAAAHLLIPQWENSLRVFFRNNGIETSSLNDQGIQEEHDLNRMLYTPGVAKVLGEDLLFELKGLLVEEFGSNLRNRMAHGLMDADEFLSPDCLYLWWLTLRTCISAAIMSNSAANKPSGP